MKWVRRIVLGFLGLIVLLMIAVTGFIFFDLNFGANVEDFSNTNFVVEDDLGFWCYLAIPEGEGQFPAVLMVHEWWGMNAHITEMADRLAEQGYVVLVPDTYRGASTNQVISALFLRLTVSESRVDSDVWAAY